MANLDLAKVEEARALSSEKFFISQIIHHFYRLSLQKGVSGIWRVTQFATRPLSQMPNP
jgi:hypothetical protein